MNEDSRFSPSIAGVVNVTDEVALYANYIEALTEISPPGRAANFDQVFPLVVSRQKEIGVKYELGDVLLTAALFEIRQPNGLTDPASNVFSISGQQLNRGLELNATGEVADGLRLHGGVTFLDASLTKTAGGETDGNKVPGIPTTNLVLYGEYDTPWVDNLTLTGRVTHASSTFFDQTNNQKISGWTKLDLGARYKFERENSKPIELRFAVDNVLNENYWASSTRGFLAAGAPRTFKVSAAFEF